MSQSRPYMKNLRNGNLLYKNLYYTSGLLVIIYFPTQKKYHGEDFQLELKRKASLSIFKQQIQIAYVISIFMMFQGYDEPKSLPLHLKAQPNHDSSQLHQQHLGPNCQQVHLNDLSLR